MLWGNRDIDYFQACAFQCSSAILYKVKKDLQHAVTISPDIREVIGNPPIQSDIRFGAVRFQDDARLVENLGEIDRLRLKAARTLAQFQGRNLI